LAQAFCCQASGLNPSRCVIYSLLEQDMSRVVFFSLFLPLVTAVEVETLGEVHMHHHAKHHGHAKYAVDAAGEGERGEENQDEEQEDPNTLPFQTTHNHPSMPKTKRPDTRKMPEKSNLPNARKMPAKAHLLNTPKMPAKANLLKAKASMRQRHRHQYRFKGVETHKEANKQHLNGRTEKAHVKETKHVRETKKEVHTENLPFAGERKPRSSALYRDDNGKKLVRKELVRKERVRRENVNTQETESSPCASRRGALDDGQSTVVRDCTQGMELSTTTGCPDVKMAVLCESFYFVDHSKPNSSDDKYQACRFTADNVCMSLGDTCNRALMDSS